MGSEEHRQGVSTGQETAAPHLGPKLNASPTHHQLKSTLAAPDPSLRKAFFSVTEAPGWGLSHLCLSAAQGEPLSPCISMPAKALVKEPSGKRWTPCYPLQTN